MAKAKPKKKKPVAKKKKAAPKKTKKKDAATVLLERIQETLNAAMVVGAAEEAIERRANTVLFQPDLDLALCIGPEPDSIEGMAEALGGDLEEMRWDGGSRAAEHSKLIPELEALVEEADGDPYAVEPAALEALVKRHSAPIDSDQAERFRDAIDAHVDD